MSKLSFRARALDALKPLPVFRCEDLPDLHEYASINRTVPQMPTGMEKDEESVRFLPCNCRFCAIQICFVIVFLLSICAGLDATKWPAVREAFYSVFWSRFAVCTEFSVWFIQLDLFDRCLWC